MCRRDRVTVLFLGPLTQLRSHLKHHLPIIPSPGEKSQPDATMSQLQLSGKTPLTRLVALYFAAFGILLNSDDQKYFSQAPLSR